jgi:hypothetical protein
MTLVKRIVFLPITLAALGYITLWGGLALWFRAPGPDLLVWGLLVIYVGLGLAGMASLLGFANKRWLVALGVVFLALLGWWNTLRPPDTGDWAPELARQVTGSIDGEILTLSNVRAFEWRTSDDFTENWVTQSYDLSGLKTVDLFLSYWGGPAMAHYMLSFGFEDGTYLAWSIEVRREANDSFSPVADFFKAHPISIIASEERDMVGLRTNIRGENVEMFRLVMGKEEQRELLETYLAAANMVAEEPHWFNSVFTNCSRTSILLARSAGISVPTDWRIIVNGYMPEFLYDIGALNTDISLEELYSRGQISERAKANGLNETFSSAVRQDVSSN